MKEGLTLPDGNNTFKGVATDALNCKQTNTLTSYYLPASPAFTYGDNGNLTADSDAK